MQRPDLASAIQRMFATAQRLHFGGRFDEAAPSYHRMLTLAPDHADTLHLLGSLRHQAGRSDEAAMWIDRARRIDPTRWDYARNLAVILGGLGREEDALACWRAVAALRPDDPDADFRLGLAAAHRGRFDIAVRHQRRALCADPALPTVYGYLGHALHRLGREDGAFDAYRRAIRLRPDDAGAISDLGVVFEAFVNPAAALDCYRTAACLAPDRADVHNNLGHAYQTAGDFEMAVDAWERVLVLDPVHPITHYTIATTRPLPPEHPARAALAAMVDRLDGATSHHHYAHAAYLERDGDHVRALDHYVKGAAIARATLHYDEEPITRRLVDITDTFDADTFERFGGGGDGTAAPVFIVGMPRSGTTLIEQILASHPRIVACGELLNLDLVIDGFISAGGAPYRGLKHRLDRGVFEALGADYIGRLPAAAAGRRPVDKMPYNYLHLGLIRLMLPDAKIVHVSRNPIDTCVACFTTRFAAGNDYSYDFGELGRYYNGYADLMAHWRRILPPGFMLEVRYEDVVDDLEGEARRLLDHLALPWDDRCLEFHTTRRHVLTASAVQVRQPIHRRSVGRWRRYGAGVQPLIDALRLGGNDEV